MDSVDKVRSLPEVLQDIVGNIRDLLRSEIRLAKTEMVEQASVAGRAAGMLGAGALMAVYGLCFTLAAAALALAIVLEPWLAALIVGVASGIIGALLIQAGRKRLKRVEPAPRRAIESVKENLQWAKQRTQ
jgi:hypothetical protein